jgi:response regulator RpfG family c-di-GMP phosphodiesterase
MPSTEPLPVPPNLLVVDDEPNILAAVARLLRKDVQAGAFVLHLVSSGQEALAFLQEHPVKLVISDQRMPAITGIELLRQIRAQYPEVRRAIFSGYSDKRLIAEALASGDIHQFLPKPWEEHQLRDTVRAGLA